MNHAWNCIVLSHFALAFPLPFHPASFPSYSPYIALFQAALFIPPPHSSLPPATPPCPPPPSPCVSSLCFPNKNTVCSTLFTALPFPCLVSAPCPFSRYWEGYLIFSSLPSTPPTGTKDMFTRAKYLFLDLNCWIENKQHCFQKNFLRCKASRYSEPAWTGS